MSERRHRDAILALGAAGCLAAVAAGALLQQRAAWALPWPRALSGGATAESVRLTRALAAFRRAGTARTGSPVVINEVMTRNPGDILDDKLTASDWVELFNRSDRPVFMGGWTLSDSVRSPRRWRFPPVTIGPRSRLIVWCSGRGETVNPLSRPVSIEETGREPWVTKRDADAPGGVAVRFRDDAPGTNMLVVALDIRDAGRYDLWLIARARTAPDAALGVSVDGAPAIAAPVAAAAAYGRVAVPCPAAADGAWAFGEGSHTVGLGASRGEVRVARLACVDRGRPGRPRIFVHAGFRLASSGEPVILADAAGNLADCVTPPAMPLGRTFQRRPDGGDSFAVAEPSPDGTLLLDGPDLSAIRSVSSGPAVVPPPAPAAGVEEIRYTLDGRAPAASDPLFREPLRIAGCAALRARGFAGGRPVTAVSTRQFWAGPPPDALTLCLAVEPDYMAQTDTGIFNRRKRRGTDWERPCHVLLLDGARVYFDGSAGVRSHGWRSLSRAKNSLYVRFRASYGEDRVRVNPFDPASPARQRALVADTSGYGWADDIGYAVTRAVGGVAPRARPLVLNANGKPLSVGTLVENVNADFLLDRWGHADFDLVKTKPPRLKLGSRDGIEKYQLFLKQRVASGDATRRAVERFVDVDSLTAWMLPLILCEASEGGKHVRREAFQGFTFLDRRRKEKSIGFIAWDMDHGFINAGYDTLNGVLTRCPFMTHVGTFRAMLRDDPSYRADFVRRAQEALNHVFRPDRWLPAVDAYAEFYRRHAAHYEEGDEGRPPTDSEVAACRAGWEEKFDAARRLLRDRPGMLWDHVRGQFDLPPPLPVRVTAAGPATVRIDGHLETLPYEGRYFPGSTLALDAGGAAASRVRGFVVNGVKLAARRMERRVDSELAVEVLPAEAGQGQEASGRP